ncbi:MAG: chromosomal replication initiator protein DnaA [Alphaproteobacteria bacterium]|nr:MAG: chromosomal replication initiator protein DnaA [Alphaproteobacteria bacterium]
MGARAIHTDNIHPSAVSRSAAHSLSNADSDSAPSTEALWLSVRALLRKKVGTENFRRWLESMRCERCGQDGTVVISLPTRFMRDWVETHYGAMISATWREAGYELEDIRFGVLPSVEVASAGQPVVVGQTQTSAIGDLPANSDRTAMPLIGTALPVNGLPAKAVSSAMKDWRDDLCAPLDARFTFDQFVVGKPNELAHAAARRVAETSSVSFNPLFLYGGVGLGKTHLMHAIAWHIRGQNNGRRVIYMSAEKFMYQFVRALRFKDTMAFKEEFRSVDVLMIDDVQFISGKDSTQEEFFHTFNALVDENRQIVVSADKSPRELDQIEERLRSRLGWGLCADIHPTSYELRLGILQSKAEQSRRGVPANVLEFLAHRITSNVRELEGALNRLTAHGDLVGQTISLDMVGEVLHDILRTHDRTLTVEDIQRRVAEHYNMRLAEMCSTRRERAVARPRQVAMYLAKQLTSRSLPDIGRRFGGRDHTTVIHAVRKVEELCQTDKDLRQDVDLLRRLLQGA